MQSFKNRRLLFSSFPTRNQVSTSNPCQLAGLSSETFLVTSIDSVQQSASRNAFQSLVAPDTLTLMKGAQVMRVRNIDNHLVNGSIGTVIGFALSSSFSDRPKGTKPGRKGGSNLWPLIEFSISQGLKPVDIREPWRWDAEVNKEIVSSRIQAFFLRLDLIFFSSQNESSLLYLRRRFQFTSSKVNRFSGSRWMCRKCSRTVFPHNSRFRIDYSFVFRPSVCCNLASDIISVIANHKLQILRRESIV